MIWNHSHDGERCDTCDDTGLAQVRGVEIHGDLVYEIGCAPCPDCEMGMRHRRFDACGMADDEVEKPAKDWKRRRWPDREPDAFIRTTADHMAQSDLFHSTAATLLEARARRDPDNFEGEEPP